MLKSGLVQERHIAALQKLVFTPQEREVVDRLGYYAQKLRNQLNLYIFLSTLSSFFLFVLFSYGSFLTNYSQLHIILVFFIALTVQVVFFNISVRWIAYTANNYKRIIDSLLDNILYLIINDFRISLAGELSVMPDPKEITKPIADAALPIISITNGLGMLIGVVLGILTLPIYYLFSQDNNYLLLFVLALVILVLYIFFLVFAARFLPRQQEFVNYSDKFDINFRATQPLLFRTHLEFHPETFYKKLHDVVSTTTIINGTTRFVGSVLPILFVFLPILILDAPSALLLITGGLYITSQTFGHAQLVSSYYSIGVARSRLTELDSLFNTIFTKGSELTPDSYEQTKIKFVKIRPNHIIKDECLYGDLNISNLEFQSGRDAHARTIHLNEGKLFAGKLNFVTGNSGSGKSIFGRLVTLRYSDFDADFIGINNQDIRTFRSLDKGLSCLHFSGLRQINTSYRQAIGSYLNPSIPQTLITQELNFKTANLKHVRKHFLNNKDYYEHNWVEIINTLDSYINESIDSTSAFISLPNSEKDQISECFKIGLKKTLSKELFIFALIMEFYSFAHLKTFIPEASLYFMDAILSEPPISQGQRRRIQFALDILVKGSVFVVDEPFSNLDIETSKNILRSLESYAQTHNAVVIVLDQEVKRDIVSACKPSSLGTFYNIKDLDDKSSQIFSVEY